MLIVDTDIYSGNFERQMTGFCTGVDDGTHGHLEGDDFRRWCAERGISTSWSRISMTNPDDSDYDRVATIWPTPGRANNGMGYHYDVGSDPAVPLRKRIESEERYYAPHIKEMERRLREEDWDERLGWNRESVQRTLDGYHEKIAASKAQTTVSAWPAYESVAIFLTEEPPASDMDAFMERVKDFAQDMMQFGRRGEGKSITLKRVFLAQNVGGKYVDVRDYPL